MELFLEQPPALVTTPAICTGDGNLHVLMKQGSANSIYVNLSSLGSKNVPAWASAKSVECSGAELILTEGGLGA